MEFHAKDKRLKFSEPMKVYAQEKIGKLSKLVEDISGSRIVLSKENHLKKLEITLPGNIRASKAGEDYYTLVVEVVERLQLQIAKYKAISHSRKKHKNNKYNIIRDENDTEEESYKIYKKLIPTEVMYEEDAVEMMELLGHSFFVFINAENRRTSVMYKRHDGEYGCLELI